MTADAAIRIRPFVDSDPVWHLTALLHRAYAELGAMGLHYTAVDQSESKTRERIGRGRCFVAEFDGAIVGTILYYPPNRSTPVAYYSRQGVAVVGQFGVEPILQRKGIGSALFARVEAAARADGATEIALDTAETATHLVELYKTRGFRIVGYEQWDTTNYRSVLMSKAL